ncbi:glutamine synthetase domain protein [Neisseria meningitidis 992008]|nr:hypothetical protein NEIPOLOT_01053 [Neisseria polysaccharea ATCC 43768]KER40612.1 glutamine synthetase domain protein [Neisseria meningitidis 992008]
MVVFQKTGRLFYNGGVQMETMPSETVVRRYGFSLYKLGRNPDMICNFIHIVDNLAV